MEGRKYICKYCGWDGNAEERVQCPLDVIPETTTGCPKCGKQVLLHIDAPTGENK